MTPKPSTKNGRPCWEIDDRAHSGFRVFAKTKEGVERKFRVLLADIDPIKFTPEDKLAKQELGDRATLLECVRFYLAHKHSGKDCLLADAIKECEQAKEKRNLRPSYLSNFSHVLSQLQTFLPAQNVSQITARDLEKFLYSNDWAAVTRVGMRNRLSAFFSYCLKQGYCKTNPVDAIEADRVEKTRPHIFTVESVVRLLDTALFVDPDMVPYYSVGVFAGVRPDELKRLSAEQVKVDQSIVDIPPSVSKTRDRRIVELSPNCVQWMRAAGNPKLMFSRRRHRDIVKASGVEWHHDIMRHTFASYHIAQHQSADKTAHELGHHGSTKMLFRHYKATVTKEDAAAFWKLEPVVLLTVVEAKTGTEG